MNSVEVRLGVNAAPYSKGLNEARAATQKFKSDIQRGGGLFGGALGKIGTAVAGLGIGNAFRGIVEKADQLQDLSDRFDVPTEALQRMGFAAEQNGSSIEGVAGAYNKLTIATDKALGGNAEMVAHFEALGVSVEDLKDKSPEQIMAQIGQGSMRASELVAVLGKSALELRPTLEALSGIKISVISEEDVAVLAQFKDDVGSVLQQIGQLGAKAGAAVVTALNEAQRGMAAVMHFYDSLMQGKGVAQSGRNMAQFFKDQREAKLQKQVTDRDEKDAKKKQRNAEAEAAAKAKAQKSAADEVERKQQGVAKAMEKAELDRQGKELEKSVKRRGMSGQEIAEGRREESAKKRNEGRADREFIRKHGGGQAAKDQLEAVKNRNDPVAQAQKEYAAAISKQADVMTKIIVPLETIAANIGGEAAIE